MLKEICKQGRDLQTKTQNISPQLVTSVKDKRSTILTQLPVTAPVLCMYSHTEEPAVNTGCYMLSESMAIEPSAERQFCCPSWN